MFPINTHNWFLFSIIILYDPVFGFCPWTQENQARASGSRAMTKKVKICLKYEFSEEHLRDVMKFSKECCEHLRNSFKKYSDKIFKKNWKSTTQQRLLTKKAIKAMARELNQMLYHSFKKINMQGNSVHSCMFQQVFCCLNALLFLRV